MKQKFLLALLFACTITLATNAQIKKGTTWLGGSIGYTANKIDNESSADYKYRAIVLLPAVGIAVKENLVAGVFITYINNLTKNNGAVYENKDNYVGGGVFVRRYVPVINKLYIFGEAAGTFRSFRTREKEYSSSTARTRSKGWETGIGVTPGVSFAVTKNLHLESGFNSLLTATYQKRNNSADVSGRESKSSSFSAGISAENDSQLYIGFRFLLNNKG